MSKLELPAFSGPLTATAMNEWLLRCKQEFEVFQLDYPSFAYPNGSRDRFLIVHAGNKISDNGVTHDLADWWRSTEISNFNNNWDEFKHQIMAQSLGSHWLAHTLKAYFTTRQEGRNADTYLRELNELRSVISNSKISKISKAVYGDEVFKYLMLYNSAPAAVEQILDRYDIVTVSVTDVKEKIQKATPRNPPDSQAGNSDQVSAPDNSGSPSHFNPDGYIMPEYWGSTSSAYKGSPYAEITNFNDINHLPYQSRTIKGVTKITLWGDKSNRFAGYSFDLEDHYDSWTMGNPPPARIEQTTSAQMILQQGEYVNVVTLGFDAPFCIRSMRITTTNPLGPGQSLQWPAITPGRVKTLAAPNGWKVVGFRGIFNDGDRIFRGLGLILAPL
ncbi:hypothetical protein CNMCM7691_000320 [Aspergillus felis]|uniref:Jacalin-type lectin domain-containing protein n=1 Tax=Aspergillus felis TaxID=1287682 RepID=A0A8H6R0D8_9EURO|nr:hypothetical protein CNMCM7691_000320 [Aspergillus felis]